MSMRTFLAKTSVRVVLVIVALYMIFAVWALMGNSVSTSGVS